MDERSTTVFVILLCGACSVAPAAANAPDVCSSCHVNATCDDKPDYSGKVCNCKYGFVGNGRTFCQDKDECQIGVTKICGQHTRCHNTYGSYYCTCLAGYTASNNMAVFIPNDGTHCQDIDECSVVGICGEGGQCGNLDGSFDCSCQLGYQVHNGTEPFHPHEGQASCQVVDCGHPTSQNTVLLSATGTTFGSVATFECDHGFLWRSGNNTSICGADGLWRGLSMICAAIDCGSPPTFLHSRMLWNQSSRVGTEVLYQCNSGYHNIGPGSVFICTTAGRWEGASMLCQEVSCGKPHTVPHTGHIWNGSSTPGSVVNYYCKQGFHHSEGNAVSLCTSKGTWTKPNISCKAKCGPVPILAHSEVVFHNRSAAIHRCVNGYHSWRGSNVSMCSSSGVWQTATLQCIEIKPPINQLFVWNEKCLQWSAEKYDEETEMYKVIYIGSRDYERAFFDKRKQFLSSKADLVQVCLGLLPATNYSIFITAVSAGFTATITINTSLTAPAVPEVHYREYETPVPTLMFRRSQSTLDPISFYQVFILPLEGILVFDCSSPVNEETSDESGSSQGHVAAQMRSSHVGREIHFTVGDGHYYGGFFNAPLKKGKSYFIILRTVSRWKKDSKSSCVLWAKVTGTSYIVKMSSLCAAASVGLLAFAVLLGCTYTWFFKKKRTVSFCAHC
ncbi:sushi domain-containing protein 1 isoform X7 [Hippocampus zosterae]|uniref:sushi domain-containing protein 1 isoform X7 n=1 Tax=Hippocampus zosterae TaxID=109293 RepID=UPI00223E4DEB|nr:sushi domain-containing protein 1 isoform X7 [Hippocampus zosterae]